MSRTVACPLATQLLLAFHQPRQDLTEKARPSLAPPHPALPSLSVGSLSYVAGTKRNRTLASQVDLAGIRELSSHSESCGHTPTLYDPKSWGMGGTAGLSFRAKQSPSRESHFSLRTQVLSLEGPAFRDAKFSPPLQGDSIHSWPGSCTIRVAQAGLDPLSTSREERLINKTLRWSTLEPT